MLLSIIIPVYHVEAYVGRVLKSIFDTTAHFDDFEVIVVNDGSKDGSMDVVKQYMDRSNLFIIEQENQGLGAARMSGLACAKGEYVWFVDSDDWLVDDGVGKVLRLLEERKGADVLMFPVLRVSDDRSRDYVDFEVDGVISLVGKDAMADGVVPKCPAFRFVLRKSLTDNEWLFFPSGLIHEDEYFGPVLMTLAERVDILPDYVYVHHQRSGSIMTSLTVRSCYDRVSIYRLLIKYMENAMDPSDWMWFRQYCVGRLVASYTSCPQFYGTPEFSRFVHSSGLYIWNQWRKAYPEASIKKKAGRLFFFAMPNVRGRILGKLKHVD